MKEEEKTEGELYTAKGEIAGFYEVIDWWLKKYRGLEHFMTNPEIGYTITSILERCFSRLEKPKILPSRKPNNPKTYGKK